MKSDQPLDDSADALDRQLRALLSVEPSPEFLVRVRGRIATDARPGFWHGWHGAARLAVPVTLLALLGIVMPNRETPVTAPPHRPADVQRESARATTSQLEPDAPATVPPLVAAERPPRRRRAMAAPVEPPVVMPAREMRAIKAFLDGIETRRATITPVVVADPPELAALAIDDIAVAVIDIAPIAIPALQQSTQ